VEKPSSPTTKPERLDYLFGNRYSSSTLQFDALKGNDRLRGEYLKELCETHGFVFWLVSVGRKVVRTEFD